MALYLKAHRKHIQNEASRPHHSTTGLVFDCSNSCAPSFFTFLQNIPKHHIYFVGDLMTEWIRVLTQQFLCISPALISSVHNFKK